VRRRALAGQILQLRQSFRMGRIDRHGVEPEALGESRTAAAPDFPVWPEHADAPAWALPVIALAGAGIGLILQALGWL
jgi:hypothetical protein